MSPPTRLVLSDKAPVKRRWVDSSFVTVRLVGYVAVLLVFLPSGKALASGLFGLGPNACVPGPGSRHVVVSRAVWLLEMVTFI